MKSEAKTPYLNTGINGNHKHTLIMMIGCLIPLVLLGILWLAGVSQNILTFGVLLLCPVMHLILMRNINHSATNHGTQSTESKADENKREELT